MRTRARRCSTRKARRRSPPTRGHSCTRGAPAARAGAHGEARRWPVDSDPAMFADWAERYRRELDRLGAIDLAMVPDILARRRARGAGMARPRSRAGRIHRDLAAATATDRRLDGGGHVRSQRMPSVAGPARRRCGSARATPRDELRAALVWARSARRSGARRAASASRSRTSRSAATRCARWPRTCCAPRCSCRATPAAPRPYDLSLGTPLGRCPDHQCGARALIALAQAPLARAAAAALLRSPYFPGSWQARAHCEREWLDEGRARVHWDDALASLARTRRRAGGALAHRARRRAPSRAAVAAAVG